ncbi:MAG TPA: thiamine pyrophosphate-dependent enzyme [Polyangiaceae bacterium]|nr:thiamine pyrophosphate-dependent enzyme [Polyangiaceae bacterium]
MESPITTLELLRVLDDDGRAATYPGLPGVPLRLEMFRHMLRARRVEERLALLQRQGAIGFFGSALGQEAVPVAAALAVTPGDWVFPALRESAIMLVRGFPLVAYLAQMFGSARDVQRGRQMPSHHAARSVRQVSWSSSIGTQLPHAVGMALAAARAGDSAIALAFMGEGATSTPDFHAALNFAGVFRARVVFVCQNNHYALSVPARRQTHAESFAVKALAYGFAGRRVDGNDALAVHRAVAEASAHARAGFGPTLVECVTYRRGPHSSSDDPSRYRTDAEERAWAERDPLARLRRHLTLVGALAPEDEAALTAAIDAELGAAVTLAAADPPPARETLFDDVYARPPWHLREQGREPA